MGSIIGCVMTDGRRLSSPAPHSLPSQGQRLGCSVALGRKPSDSGSPGGFHMLSPRSPENSTGSQQRLQEAQLLLPQSASSHQEVRGFQQAVAKFRLPNGSVE